MLYDRTRHCKFVERTLGVGGRLGDQRLKYGILPYISRTFEKLEQVGDTMMALFQPSTSECW